MWGGGRCLGSTFDGVSQVRGGGVEVEGEGRGATNIAWGQLVDSDIEVLGTGAPGHTGTAVPCSRVPKSA